MFKFTSRELLLLTLVIGLTAGWWTDRARLVARERQSADAAKKADMQTYALENVMQHMGLTTEW